MIKVYESGSDIAISIVTKKGNSKFINFDSKSNGSALWTEDEDIQWGIEHHSWFGKNIVLKCVYEEECQNGCDQRRCADNGGEDESAENGGDDQRRSADNGGEDESVENGGGDQRRSADNGGDEESELKTITVSGADDAVEYLMENYGMKAKQLKSMKSIRKAASEHGIVFDGLD